METRHKKKSAVAVQSELQNGRPPRIIAKGDGKTAEKIIEIARANGIYIHNDPDMIEVLSQIDIYEEIPPQLYIIIAELLAFIYSLNKGKKLL